MFCYFDIHRWLLSILQFSIWLLIVDKGKTKLKFSIHSNSNQERPIQELKIKKENSCTEDKEVYANEEFDILEDINEEDDIVPYKLIPYERKEGPYPSMAELLEGLQGNNGTPSFLNSNVVKFIVISPIK